MAKHSSDYSAKAKRVAKYVTFKVTTKGKPSASEKARVNKYHRLIYGYKNRDGDNVPGLSSGAKFAYRTKSKKLLTEAQRYGGSRHNKFIKVAFVPWDGINKPKLKLVKGKVEDRQEFLTRRIIPFDVELLADGLSKNNVAEVVAEAIAREKGITAFNVMAGDQGFEPLEKGFGTASPELTPNLVMQYMAKYDQDNGHHYSEWLFGLVGYTFRNQKKFEDYKEHRKAYAKLLRSERRNARRRAVTKMRKDSRH